MAKLVALYRKPADAKAFDAYYFSRHVPTANLANFAQAGVELLVFGARDI